MKRRKNNNNFMVMLPYLIVLIVILAALFFVNGKRTEVHDIKTGELIQEIKEENVTEITVTPKSGESVYIVTGKLKDYDDKESFTTRVIPEEIRMRSPHPRMRSTDS